MYLDKGQPTIHVIDDYHIDIDRISQRASTVSAPYWHDKEKYACFPVSHFKLPNSIKNATQPLEISVRPRFFGIEWIENVRVLDTNKVP